MIPVQSSFRGLHGIEKLSKTETFGRPRPRKDENVGIFQNGRHSRSSTRTTKKSKLQYFIHVYLIDVRAPCEPVCDIHFSLLLMQRALPLPLVGSNFLFVNF